MATHAHNTRTPLLRPSGSPQSLLGLGLGRQPGPVTIAIAAMRSADPDLDRQRLRELRRRIADRIEADLALLDALDSDPDSEPSLGAPEPIISSWKAIGPNGALIHVGDQAHWADGATYDGEQDAGDEREEEDEHGGDIQDEPHDLEPDREPDEHEAPYQPVFMDGGAYAKDSFGRRA